MADPIHDASALFYALADWLNGIGRIFEHIVLIALAVGGACALLLIFAWETGHD